MRDGIHPLYQERAFTCSCGNVINVATTAEKDSDIDVCSQCHPFYTGKQKKHVSHGRADRFNRLYGKTKNG